MNNIGDMMPSCRSCPYWEIAEEPYVCCACLKKTKEIFNNNDVPKGGGEEE